MRSKRDGTSTAPRRAALCAISTLACVLVAPLAQAQATTQTFNPTGAEQTFTVPAGVTHINVLAIGEAGGGGEVGGAAGGLPAEARGEVSVTPGQTLYVEVAQGTFNGGAAGGGATSKNIGGGASDVRTSPRAAGLSPDTRSIVAGGGGGGGESDASGAPGAGGNAGQPGNNAEPLAGFPTAEGGGAGTLTHGGAGGVGQGNGAAGTLGSGGRGGGNNPSFGGGGAGGYYGGGGGGGGGEIAAGPAGAGGGGGSSLVPAGGSTTLASLGTKPVVQISYTAAPVAPRWAINGKSAGSKHEPAFTLGKIEMKNAVLGTLACKDFTSMNIWNEVKEGTERGLDETTGHYNWECKAALPCEVTNERGVEKEGTFATVEGPPTFQETEKKARRTGNTSVPWPGELIETEKAVYDLIHHVRLWAVVPLGTEMGGPGKGPGCVLGGSEIPFEDQEGLTEKAAGDEIKAQVVNGQKNGMDPSKLRFEGEKPETGRLISQASGPLYMTGEVKGPSGETDYELVQAR